MSILTLAVKLTANAEQYIKTMEHAKKVAQTTAQNVGANVSKIGGSVITGIKKMARTAALALGSLTVAASAALLSTVGPASDLNESINAVSVVFGDAKGAILDYGKTASEMVGLSNREFNQLATTTGAFLQNLGYDSKGAAEKTIELTERAADMASVFNTDVSTAMSAIQSGLKGEFNPLEQFGVKINAATIAQKALEMGLAGSTAELTDQMKAQAALALIMEQTDKVQGDFLNTANGVANIQRRLSARFEDVKAKIGSALLPVLSDLGARLVDVLNNPETEAFIDRFVEGISRLAESVGGFITDFIEGFSSAKASGDGTLEAIFGSLAQSFFGLEDISPIFRTIGEGILWIMDAFKRIVAAFQQDHGLIVAALAAVATVILSAVIPAAISLVTTMLPILLVVGLIAGAAYVLYTAWQNNWGGIQEKTAAAVEFIKTTVSTFLTTIKTWWAAHGEAIKFKVKVAWEVIKALFRMYLGIFISLFQAFSAAFQGDWYTFGEKLREAWDKAWQLIKTVLAGAWLLLKPLLIELKDNIVNYFKNVDWGSVGKNIITGIGNGLRGMIGWLRDAARDAASAAFEAAKGFLGIHSDSRKFMMLAHYSATGYGHEFVRQMARFQPAMNAAMVGTASEIRMPSVSGGSVPKYPVSPGGYGGGNDMSSRLLMALEEFNQRLRSFPDDLARANESTFQKIIGGRR